ERIKRLKKRLDEMVAQKKPQQSIVRLKKSIKRLKSRISELKARLADPSEYKSTPETIATTGSSEPQIKRLGDYTYGITKDSLKKILPFLKGSNSDVRVAPNRNGGFRTFLVKPQSIFYKLGIRSGDIIQKFNNIPLNSAQETLDAFTKSKDVTNHTLTLSRRGRSLTILYKIE
ncbi:hypothetical protein KKF84_08360, partial [Myxococcota bacterium]|nr:hypothetical protein [Myxococcota bacterium]